MSKLIYIYNDEGCSGNNNLKDWLVKQLGSDTRIKLVMASDIRHGILQDSPPDALFIGGGKARFFAAKLKRTGRAYIRDYVKKGGKYFGICAGAYYAASEINYEEHSKGCIQRIVSKEADGQLCLFDGKAIGVVHDYNGNGDYRHTAKIRFADKLARIYYFMGPYFDKFGKSVEVLANFAGRTNHPAAVKSKYGKGTVILSAIHPEHDAKSLTRIGLKAKQKGIDAFSKYLLSDLLDKHRPLVSSNDACKKQQKGLYRFVSEMK